MIFFLKRLGKWLLILFGCFLLFIYILYYILSSLFGEKSTLLSYYMGENPLWSTTSHQIYSFASNPYVYAIDSDSHTLWRSKDFIHFQKVMYSEIIRRGSALAADSKGALFLVGGRNFISRGFINDGSTSNLYNDVWKSNDNGLTWEKVLNHTPFRERFSHAFFIDANDNLYVIGGNAGQKPGYFEEYGTHDEENGVKIVAPSLINDAWVSSNGGSLWKEISLNIPNIDWDDYEGPPKALFDKNKNRFFLMPSNDPDNSFYEIPLNGESFLEKKRQRVDYKRLQKLFKTDYCFYGDTGAYIHNEDNFFYIAGNYGDGCFYDKEAFENYWAEKRNNKIKDALTPALYLENVKTGEKQTLFIKNPKGFIPNFKESAYLLKGDKLYIYSPNRLFLYGEKIKKTIHREIYFVDDDVLTKNNSTQSSYVIFIPISIFIYHFSSSSLEYVCSEENKLNLVSDIGGKACSSLP